MIQISQAAGEKVRELLENEQKADHALRVFVAGGGCSGFQYGLAFDNDPQEDDWIIEDAGIQVYVDAMSAMYLSGAEIDYKDGLMESGFVIHNPNAVSSCACGQSFQTNGDGHAHAHGHGQTNRPGHGGGCCGQ